MADSNGFVLTNKNPGWIKKKVPDSYADDGLKKIIIFYVINTPCEDLSSSSISIKHRGWEKDVWTNGKLKSKLFKVANLEKNTTFSTAKTIDGMKEACNAIQVTNSFYKNRNKEKIAIYKPSRYNEFLAICYHIRNAFAHGRLAMYSIKKSNDIMFVLEDGLNYNGKFQVRSRMILKKSTLLKWIGIIEKGKLEDS